MHIGIRIKQWRKTHGVKQEAFAYEVGVTQAAVSRWERGIDEPNLHAKRRICEIMGKPRSGLDKLVKSLVSGTSEYMIITDEKLRIQCVSNGIETDLGVDYAKTILHTPVTSIMEEPEAEMVTSLNVHSFICDVETVNFYAEVCDTHCEVEIKKPNIVTRNEIKGVNIDGGSSLSIWKFEFEEEEAEMKLYVPKVDFLEP